MADHHHQEKHKIADMVSSAGYCYSDVSSGNPNIQLINQLQQSFESNPEIYNLTTSMDMTGFPQPDHQPTSSWPDHDHTRSLPFDDSSLRCVFPCEGNERPSQGLSLSLSSTNPSTIGLQSFELRQQQQHQQESQDHGFFGKPVVGDGFLGKAANLHHHGQFVQIRNSKYLGPAQELLNEFCSLGTNNNQTDPKGKIMKPHKITTNTMWQQQQQQQQEENGSTSSSSKNKSLYGLEFIELQKRKAKLLSMLEEVDRRYRHYCDQMKAVVSSFEAVAGSGAAGVYSALASKAMSRHFRCLRDGIVGQIKDTKNAMGEKDHVTVGASKGETPRLRVLDQTLRQQRAIQQMSLMESHPWRPQRGLPERSVSVLRAWLFEHFLHPYPSDVDKHILARQTGLSRSQVSNWFINARVRLWKPMVEEMYLEETKEAEDDNNNNIGLASPSDDIGGQPGPNSLGRAEDQKPTPAQLVRIDSECLSSIINNPDKNDTKHMSKSPQDPSPHHHHHGHHLGFGRVGGDAFGAIELDFSSYNHHRAAVSYPSDNAHQSFGGGGGSGGGGGGVSLTLGLQQHVGSGVSLAFSPTSQSSLFYPRDHIEDCQPVQYSILDGEGQNLPYRNLMGAQLLHDLAG